MAARRLSTGEHDTDLERPGRGGLGRRHQRRRGLAEEVGEELGDLICDRSIESDELDGKAHARPEIRRYGQRGTVGPSLTGVARGGAGGAVDDGEVGAEDGGERQRVQEPVRLHLAVHGGQPAGRRPAVRRHRAAVGRHRRRRHASVRFRESGAECVSLIWVLCLVWFGGEYAVGEAKGPVAVVRVFYGGRDGDLVIWSGGGWRAPGFVACPRFGPSGAAAGDVLVVLPWGT